LRYQVSPHWGADSFIQSGKTDRKGQTIAYLFDALIRLTSNICVGYRTACKYTKTGIAETAGWFY